MASDGSGARPVLHRVRPGDCVASIAAAYGVARWQDVWDHPKNQGLKNRRKDPHVLAPGDVVFVPAEPPGALSFSSGSDHTFQAPIPRVPLKLVLRDHRGNALAGKAYVLEVGVAKFEGNIPGSGVVEHEVAATAVAGTLRIAMSDAPGGDLVLPLRIGHLDPPDTVTGIQSRLHALGFACPASGRLDPPTRKALAIFQERHQIAPTGEPDPATCAKLAEVHTGG